MIYRKTTYCAVGIFWVVLLCAAGCGRAPARPQGVIGYVNNEPILESELKRELTLRAQQDPHFKLTPETRQEQLDAIIDRRLIIQEAMKEGMARQQRFIDTIQSFWEQTLIRDFFDSKRREFLNKISIQENEIRDYYNKLSLQVTFRMLKSKNADEINQAYVRYLSAKEKETTAWDAVGPLRYEDINVRGLREAFALPEGDVQQFDDPPYYYIIQIAHKETVDIGPYESLKGELKRRLVAMKEQGLFEDWLKEKRRCSAVRVFPARPAEGAKKGAWQ